MKRLNIALPKGRLGEKVYEMLETLGYGCPGLTDGSRKLIFEDDGGITRYFCPIFTSSMMFLSSF